MGGDSLQSRHNADSDMGSDDEDDKEDIGIIASKGLQFSRILKYGSSRPIKAAPDFLSYLKKYDIP